MTSKNKNISGFSLIEMMIVVVVVAILAAIALPAYQDYVRKARRSDGMDALLFWQTLQEKWRANNVDYATLQELGCAATCLSNEGFYSLSVTVGGNGSSTSYTIRAVPQGDQANDTDGGASCNPLWLVVDANNPRGAKRSGTYDADADNMSGACW